MKTITLSVVIVIVGAILVLPAVPALAAPRTWVAGTGDDINPCSRTAPCKTFNGALAKTDAFGMISVIDSGAYGSVSITKSISIIAEGVQAGILAPAGDGIHVAAGPNDVVHIRGLVIDGDTTGQFGILVSTAREVHVENCLIRGFQGGKSGAGIAFEPTGAGVLFVSETTLTDNGKGSVGGGIWIAPGVGGNAVAVIDRVRAHANAGFGIKADSTSGSVSMTVRDAVLAGNFAGAGISVLSPVGGKGVIAVIDRTASVHNQFGVVVDGLGTLLQISNSTVTANTGGLAAANSGKIISYGNNNVGVNVTDGAPTGVIAPK